MHGAARDNRRVWFIISIVASVLALLAMSYSISAQESDGFECQWEKEVWINGTYAGQWDEGPFKVVLSDTVTMSEALSCNFDYAWVVHENWLLTGGNNIKFVGADYVSGTVEELWGGMRWYDGDYSHVAAPAGTWVTITKDLEVAHPGPVQLQIDESFISYPFENVGMMQRTVELENLVEGGDAPTSKSHSPYTMTTYPGSGVQANFPVVWDWNGTLGLSPPVYGFCHYASGTSFLGTAPTYELDADLLPDDDSVTNIDPSTDTPNRDGSDDGVTFPLLLPHCGTATVHVEGENHSGGTLYLNAWADWTRDGDWADWGDCSSEWIIQDEPVPAPSGPPYTFTLDIPITPSHPGLSTEPLWVRATLTEVELEPLDSYYYEGAQPNPAWRDWPDGYGCFQDGETEDYFIEPLPTDCLWEKQVSINGEYAGEWDEGPFTAGLDDEVTIDQAVSCNFDYGWSVSESWDSSVLYLTQHHELSGTVTTDWSSNLYWHRGSSARIPANTWVTMTNTLRVKDSGWASTIVNESAAFDPIGLTMQPRPVVLEEPACDWDKTVYINDEYAGEWDEGPFAVMIDDMVAINDELECNFDYEWSLLEEWNPNLLSFVAEEHISGTVALDPPASPDSLHWYGGDPVRVPAGTSVIISKTLSVDQGFSGQRVISETVQFSPYAPMTWEQPVALESHVSCIPLVLKKY